jgi:hypothetical protein
MSLSITGLGTASPTFSISQRDACELTYEFNCDTPYGEKTLSRIKMRSSRCDVVDTHDWSLPAVGESAR